MLAVQSAQRRACTHSAVPRKGAGTGRDHSKALTTTLRATGSPETLCTLHAPLLNSRGLVADCGGYAVTCWVEEEGEGWVVKRSKTGAGFATLLDFEPTAFAVASSGRTLAAASGYIKLLEEGTAVTVPGLDTSGYLECYDKQLDFQPTAFAVASSGRILVAAPGFVHMFDSKGKAVTVTVPGQDTAACMECLDN
ncbi:hypothetical protein HaLaN_26259, partial [Haematococcus lacustris]